MLKTAKRKKNQLTQTPLKTRKRKKFTTGLTEARTPIHLSATHLQIQSSILLVCNENLRDLQCTMTELAIQVVC